MSKIIAVKKEGTEIVGYRLDDGREYSKESLIQEVMLNNISIEGCEVRESSTGEFYLRSLQDGDSTNNLNSLPVYGDTKGYSNNHSSYKYPHRIVAVRKDGSDIYQFKLEDGTVLSQPEAVDAVKNNQIGDYVISTSVYGEEFIRSYPDTNPANNLSNLPEF